jgi:molybdopterin molybdotransferase
MITVQEARAALLASISPLPVKEVALHKASGHYAAQDVHAPHDHPLFDNSAVDGYAFAYVQAGTRLRVVSEIAAGDRPERTIGPGECARIFTGAMLPEGADTVVMQEFIQREGNIIHHNDQKLVRGGNIRRRGEQLRAGDRVLEQGACLDAVTLGLLASVGIRTVRVHEWPQVSVIITGNEFAVEDAEPQEGRIFSSNDIMLDVALRQAGINPLVLHAGDTTEELEIAFAQAFLRSDLVITTGGVSVGDHDLVRPVLDHSAALVLFHKVSQKPGKPMLLARNGGSLIMGLPGNPRAVMILFWEYVLPAIRALMGAAHPWPRTDHLPLGHAVQWKGERSEFRAARITDGRVELLRDEGSHMLASLLSADAIACLPDDRNEMKAGDMVEVHFIPGRA